jgi:hypothetical protein
MKNKILYKGDCPNKGDFERVQKNLERTIKTQEEFYEWKSKQPVEYSEYNEWGLN